VRVNTRNAIVGELGFDTLDAAGAAANADGLRSTGLLFAMIYVERSTPEIVHKLLEARLDVCFLSQARVSGWSATAGALDGKRAAQRLLALGVPPDVSLGCDLEAGVPDEPTAIAYVNAWYDSAITEGLHADAPDLYVGAGSGFLSPDSLFHKVAFRRYHRSMSIVPNVTERGYCCLQLFPGDQSLFGVAIDFDVMQQDYFGGTLTLITL